MGELEAALKPGIKTFTPGYIMASMYAFSIIPYKLSKNKELLTCPSSYLFLCG